MRIETDFSDSGNKLSHDRRI